MVRTSGRSPDTSRPQDGFGGRLRDESALDDAAAAVLESRQPPKLHHLADEALTVQSRRHAREVADRRDPGFEAAAERLAVRAASEIIETARALRCRHDLELAVLGDNGDDWSLSECCFVDVDRSAIEFGRTEVLQCV